MCRWTLSVADYERREASTSPRASLRPPPRPRPSKPSLLPPPTICPSSVLSFSKSGIKVAFGFPALSLSLSAGLLQPDISIVYCTLYIIQGFKIQLTSSSTIQKRRPGSMLHITFSTTERNNFWFSCLWFRVVPQNRRRVEQVVRNWVRKIGQFRLRRVRATLPPFSIRCRCSAGKLGNLGRQ